MRLLHCGISRRSMSHGSIASVRDVRVTSAHPPKAVVKPTSVDVAKAHARKRNICAAANSTLFDHLVGAGEQHGREFEAKLLRSF